MSKTLTKLQHKLHTFLGKAVKSHNKINDTINEVYYNNFRSLYRIDDKRSKRDNH
ncbi:hypothetical protein P0136_07610 [Lentisphaerota bacterium ZTH]|nr:hypothetical protein JYG24_01275 [Lentisphaerota bacterium]WET05236.1 hypothetical protein P0136_07610 [Lentisphaerota bacterium ZTH]